MATTLPSVANPPETRPISSVDNYSRWRFPVTLDNAIVCPQRFLKPTASLSEGLTGAIAANRSWRPRSNHSPIRPESSINSRWTATALSPKDHLLDLRIRKIRTAPRSPPIMLSQPPHLAYILRENPHA
jgi:hypothetical protein